MVFPIVPIAPGVPPLPRAAGVAVAAVQLVVGDALSLFAGLGDPDWGLFFNGLPVVTAESVISFDFRKGFSISNFPIENGGFESYNKVQRPFDVRLRFSTGGTLAERQALLDSIDEAVESLDLMDAVTPEATYQNVNPIHYDYRRSAMNGVGLLVVDVFCEQVRVAASTSFTSSKSSTGTVPTADGGTRTEISVRPAASIVSPQSPSASPQVNGGTVQPTPANQAAIDSVLAQSMLPF